MTEIKSHRNVFESKVPTNFIIPTWEHARFTARKLCISDCYNDYINVLESRELIQKIRGGDWPSGDLTVEDNLIDLGFHQRQSEYNQSFAYILISKDGEYMGCFYIYPMGFRTDVTDSNSRYDADISFWITNKFYSEKFYFEFWKDLQDFLQLHYPFFSFYFSNKLQN